MIGLPNGTCIRMDVALAASTIFDPREVLTLSSQKVIKIAAALTSVGIPTTPPWRGRFHRVSTWCSGEAKFWTHIKVVLRNAGLES